MKQIIALAILSLFAAGAFCALDADVSVVSHGEAAHLWAGQDTPVDDDTVPVDQTYDCIANLFKCIDCAANIRCTKDLSYKGCKLTDPETKCDLNGGGAIDCGFLIKYPKVGCFGLPAIAGDCKFNECV